MTYEYFHSKDEAAQIARAALPLANKYSLPANPIIYAVFYEHLSGQNPELSEALGDKLGDSSLLSNENIRDLFHSFISQSDEHAVEVMRIALGSLVENTHSSLDKMDGETSNYQDYLSEATNMLEKGLNTDPKALLHSLLEQTEHMQSATKLLQEELDVARQEIQDLRNEFKRVRHESLVDPLTNAKNRRAFDIALDEICKSSVENDWPVCLLLLDIDHFKNINDSYGHGAGDAVLKWIAKVINDTVRGSDVVARYGGEEFTIILPKTDLNGAMSAAENIRQRISEQRLRTSTKQIGRITCSIGVSLYNVNEGYEALITSADSAMYRAKQAGRDKVCCAGTH